jgi:hypothetical protein
LARDTLALPQAAAARKANMKRKFYAVLAWAIIASPGYALDQWPGQSDFGNVNGPTVNNDDPYRQKPIVDFRFGSPRPPSGSRVETTLTPAEYSYCRQVQMQSPAMDISCEGPNVP